MITISLGTKSGGKNLKRQTLILPVHFIGTLMYIGIIS